MYSRRQKKISVHYLRYVISTIKARLDCMELVRSHKAYLHRTFDVPLFVPLPYFIRGRFVNFSARRNKSLLTQGHFSFAGNNGPLFCYVYSSISLSVCLKITVWNGVDVLARCSISHSHCGHLSPSCN